MQKTKRLSKSKSDELAFFLHTVLPTIPPKLFTQVVGAEWSIITHPTNNPWPEKPDNPKRDFDNRFTEKARRVGVLAGSGALARRQVPSGWPVRGQLCMISSLVVAAAFLLCCYLRRHAFQRRTSRGADGSEAGEAEDADAPGAPG